MARGKAIDNMYACARVKERTEDHCPTLYIQKENCHADNDDVPIMFRSAFDERPMSIR